jgi:hypothetical protein
MNIGLLSRRNLAVILPAVALVSEGTAGAETTRPNLHAAPIELETLLNLSEEQLAKVDTAAANLACADGLPGAEDLEPDSLLEKLYGWTEAVRAETEKYHYKFEADPVSFEHSEARYRMIVLITVLMQDFGVKYNSERIHNVDFTRPHDLFLSGLLRGTGGTCVSMPVLYVVIGRRLGYPLKLVEAPEHLFLRWEDPRTGERFNIEGTSQGFVSEPDEYYKEWPRNLSHREHEQGYFLKSLSPKEEVAVFLTTRGHALHDMGNLPEAQETYEKALALSPKNIPARTWLTRTFKKARTGRGVRKPVSRISRASRRHTSKTSGRRTEISQGGPWPQPRRASTKSSE